MKWFGVDSDTPNDPKIRALVLQGGPDRSGLHARARMGGLFFVWCHIADHGAEPGRGIDAEGRPLPLQEIADAAYFDSVEELRTMLDFCASRRHIDPEAWSAGVIAIPAMAKRADEYTKRLLKKQATKPIKTPEKTPDSRECRETRRESPDSPLCTVVPVGVVPPPVITGNVRVDRERGPAPANGSSDPRSPIPDPSTPLFVNHAKQHALCGPNGSCITHAQFRQFMERVQAVVADPYVTVLAFARKVITDMAPGAVIPQVFKFWDQQFEAYVREQFPAAIPVVPVGATAPARHGRGPSHTPVDANAFAGVTIRDEVPDGE